MEDMLVQTGKGEYIGIWEVLGGRVCVHLIGNKIGFFTTGEVDSEVESQRSFNPILEENNNKILQQGAVKVIMGLR